MNNFDQLVMETAHQVEFVYDFDRIRRNRDDKVFDEYLLFTALKIFSFGMALCSFALAFKLDFFVNHPTMAKAVSITVLACLFLFVGAVHAVEGILFRILVWLVLALQLAF
ncbi:uncharacterized protein LOC110923018 isoform X2 [Helianthus annuus]|uniref:uncharacterized protein LOC110923018 isoform X2 n=1 Tax=Helianthus annuus TaxID=4232 RepID=UPI000B8F4898|nr:uncharacterized protein LOC110923018 isoform X2 [Helianthus annuus]